MGERHFVCTTAEVPDGAARIVPFKNRSIGIFRIGDGYHALLNVCPHRGAALCEGPVCGTTRTTDRVEFVYEREGEIIRCAWHGWEFEIATGRSLVDPSLKARTFETAVENGRVYILF
jgi:nitrite reductase (NADH) small subunit